MLSNKFIAEYDKKEVTWYISTRENTFHAIVLADKKKGVSIKPFWDEEEKQRFIDLFVAHGNNREDVINLINMPFFCFASAGRESKVADLRKAIDNGNFDVLRSYGNKPICPFA